MFPKSSLFWPLLLLFLLAVACGKSAQGSYGRGLPEVPASPRIAAMEHQMFERLNRDRRSEGHAALTYDDALASAARSQSEDMRDHHFFSHESPQFGLLEQRLDRAGYPYVVARENLAEARDVQRAEDRLLQSVHHHENIMANDIDRVGIGIVDGGVADPRNLTITQIFATRARSESVAEARSAIEKSIVRARQRAGLPPIKADSQLTESAERALEGTEGPLTEEALSSVGRALAQDLERRGPRGATGISVGGQVVVDSKRFEPQPALLEKTARSYGLAVDRRAAPGQRPMLRVLIAVER